MATAHCNLCGSIEFVDVNNRPKALCKSCGSYERTRLMHLYLVHLGIQQDMRILHFAPESGLYRWLRTQVNDYVCADFDIKRYPYIPDIKFVDLMEPASYERFGTFDLIIHSHVIEHVAYNYSALLLRLHRMLLPGGVHAFSIPIYGKSFREDYFPLGKQDAENLFGQFDHVRRFSPCDLNRTIGAIFRLKIPNLIELFGDTTLIEANIPMDCWDAWSGNSVFWLKHEDCLF